MGKAYTYISRPFAGTVVVEKLTHKKRIKLNSPLWYENEVNKFSEGDQVTIQLTNRRAKRTESQNNYWWGVYLPLILKEGMGSGSAADTHEDLARKFLTVKEWRNSRGQICYVRKSTAELTVGQFCEFIINVQAETGVEAPPTENFDLAPLKEGIKDNGKSDSDATREANQNGDPSRGNSADRGSVRPAPKKRAKRASSNRPSARRSKGQGEQGGN